MLAKLLAPFKDGKNKAEKKVKAPKSHKKEKKKEEALKEKQQICEQLEVELVRLRDKLDSKVVQEKFEKSLIV